MQITFKKSPEAVMVFKTNIIYKKDIKKLSPVLSANPQIIKWNVDSEDVDKVLRIVPEKISAEEIIRLVEEQGYNCEELPD